MNINQSVLCQGTEQTAFCRPRQLEEDKDADASLKAALAENKFVPPYLLGRKKMPRNLPDHYGFGDDAEAVLYAYGNKAAWQSTPEALEWLAAKLK